ncbi:hypothetical protein ACFXD5_12860 [Streptomyces sp. NPDC059385]|uniref:hypothetical protein n=1 Tax=Streptomyces sp. NPDC059385 TaxID=3346817 RepID=UPI0036A6EF14
MEREYIHDRTLEGHKSARKRGKTIGGAGVTEESMLSMAHHLREQEMSPRDIAKRLDLIYGRQTWSSGGKPVQRSSAGRWPVSLKRRTAGGRSGV